MTNKTIIILRAKDSKHFSNKSFNNTDNCIAKSFKSHETLNWLTDRFRICLFCHLLNLFLNRFRGRVDFR